MAHCDERISVQDTLDSQVYDAVPIFTPPSENYVVECPLRMSNAGLKKATIAHKFATGWYIGVFKKKTFSGEHKGSFEVYYKDDKKTYYHELSLDQYGVDKHWLVLGKRK